MTIRFLLAVALLGWMGEVRAQNPALQNLDSDTLQAINDALSQSLNSYNTVKSHVDDAKSRIAERAEDQEQDFDSAEYERLLEEFFGADHIFWNHNAKVLHFIMEMVELETEIPGGEGPYRGLMYYLNQWTSKRDQMLDAREAALQSFGELDKKIAELRLEGEFALGARSEVRPAIETQITLSRMGRVFFRDPKVKEKLSKLQEEMDKKIITKANGLGAGIAADQKLSELSPAEVGRIQEVLHGKFEDGEAEAIRGFLNERVKDVVGTVVFTEINCVKYYVNQAVFSQKIIREFEPYEAMGASVSETDMRNMQTKINLAFGPLDEKVNFYSQMIVTRSEKEAALNEVRRRAASLAADMIIELNKSTIQVVRKEVNEAYDQQGVLSELVDAVYWSFGGLHYGNQLLNDFDYLLQRVSVIGQRVHGIWKLETVEEILERIKSIDRDIQNLDSTVCALLTDVAQFKQLSAQRALAIKTTVAMIVATIVAIPTGGSSYVFAWGAVAGSATFVGLAMINHASGRPTTFKEYAIDAAFGAVVGMIAVTGVKIDQYILANAGRVSMLKYLSAQTIVAGGMRAGIAGTAIGAELQFANSIFEGKNPFSPEEAKKIVHSAAMGGVFGFACGVLIQAGVRSYSNWRNPLTPAELSILRGAVAATEAEGRNLNLLWSKLLTAMRNGEASMTPAVLQVMEKLRIKLHFNFIRGADELSAARIEIKMLAQMKLLKPNEIDAFIAALKGDLPDDLARAYFLHASEFSNPRHFLELANEISRKNLVLVTDGGATLNETLAYVGKKHGTTVQVSRIPDYLSATPGAFNGKALILDDYVMQLMEANPGFARSVLDSNCKLVYPQGFDRINIFRQAELTGPTGLAQRLNEDLRAFAAAKADNPNFLVQDWFILKKTETLLEMARNLRMNRSVNARLIPDRMVLITNPKLYGRSPGNMQWAELFDNPAVAWDALRAELSSLNSASRQAVLELMDQNLHFFSPRGLSFDWKAYRAQTIQEAAAMGAGPDDVYYFVFQAEKSNSLAAQHLMEAAGVPANRIVAPRNLGSVPPGKVVVMIDDLNLSGDTFAIQCARFVGQNPNLKFVVAPLAATKVAQRAVERSLSGFGNQRLMAPIRQVEHFETLDWFRFLPSREKELLISIMGKRGYREGSTGISTWYMSPDNNMVTSNPLFNRVIKEFIVSPAGYKLGSGTPFNEVPSGIDGRWLREYQ